MEKHKIDRINELARKKKSDGLTDEEAAEHAALRQEYIAGFRENMRQVLEHIRPAPGRYENETTEKDPNKIIIPHSVGESQQQNFSPTPCISGTFRV